MEDYYFLITWNLSPIYRELGSFWNIRRSKIFCRDGIIWDGDPYAFKEKYGHPVAAVMRDAFNENCAYLTSGSKDARVYIKENEILKFSYCEKRRNSILDIKYIKHLNYPSASEDILETFLEFKNKSEVDIFFNSLIEYKIISKLSPETTMMVNYGLL